MKTDYDRLGIGRLTVLIGLLACYFVFRAFHQLLDDPGIGWHLQSGAWVLSHRELLKLDPFLSVSRPWISDQWLSDVLLAELFSLGGWSLLSIAALFLFFTPAFLILPKVLSTIDRPFSQIALAFSLAVALSLMSVHLLLRPVLFSFIFFSLQILFVACVTKMRSSQRAHDSSLISRVLNKPLGVYLLTAVLYILWSNMHPSFVLGLIVLFLGAVSIVIERFFLKASVPETSATNILIMCAIVGLISSLMTPYGTELHQSILSLGQSDFFMKLNNEWLPLSIRDDRGLLLCLSWSLIFFSTYLREASGAKMPCSTQRDTTETFMTCGSIIFSAAAFFSARFLPYAAMFIFFPLLWNISWLSNYYLQGRLLSLPKSFGIAFFFISLASGVLAGSYCLVFDRALALGPSVEKYPYSLLDRAKTIATDRPTLIYNHPDVGGFITFFSKNSTIKPVLDDRNTLLGEQLYREFLDAKTEHLLAQAAKSHGADLVMQSIARIPQDLSGSELTELSRTDEYVLFQVR